MLHFITTLLLACLYWFVGIIYAIGISATVGMALCSLAALLNIFKRRAWAFVIGYLAAALGIALILWGGLFVIGFTGDHTHYRAQTALIVGLVFPGVFALKIIPKFITIALGQINGETNSATAK